MFDLNHDYYYFSTNRLSFSETIVFSLKLFWNMFFVSILIATPIVMIQYMANIISVN